MAFFPIMALAFLLLHPVLADQGWIEGRATFYDDNTQGSCHFKTDIPAMYAAWPDTLAGFEGSCGRCLEVACVNKDFTDRYGGQLERSSACYDEARTVVVKIVDSCPCVHQNYASNQRWCCGDMNHLDLGRAAFHALAPERYGVIGLKWRQVDCSRLGADKAYDGEAAPAADGPDAPAAADDGGDLGALQQGLDAGSSPSSSSDQPASGQGRFPAWGHVAAPWAAGWQRQRGAGFGALWSGGRVWGA